VTEPTAAPVLPARRVYLLGFMGSGKSTVGERVAAVCGWPFVDLDSVVEAAAGQSVREIFDRLGEPAFRELEHLALRSTLELPAAVVATGGGTPTFPRNVELLRRGGVTVWVNPPFATIVRRIGALGKHDRPLFRSEAEALDLYRARLPAYRAADHRLDVADAETPEEVAVRLLFRLRQDP
jgi:shikimate kinase